MKIWTNLSSILSQITRLADRQTEFSSLDRVCIPFSTVKTQNTGYYGVQGHRGRYQSKARMRWRASMARMLARQRTVARAARYRAVCNCTVVQNYCKGRSKSIGNGTFRCAAAEKPLNRFT